MNKDNQQQEGSPGEIGALVDAFRYFNEAASSLNVAYHRLEARIEQLTEQLEEKDRELYSRLRELDRVTKYLNSLLETIPSGIIAVDMEGNINIFNRTAGEIIKTDAESTIGKPYSEVMGDDNLDTSAIYTLMNGPEIRSVEKSFDDGACKVEVSTTWVVDSLGERIGVIEIMDEVSTIRRMQERFEQQKTLFALGEMASAVAHELRNPLAGIGGFAALLMEDLADYPQKQELVKKILQGVHDLEKVAENLLFLTRRTEIKRSQTDLKALLNDIIQLLKAEIHRFNIEVKVRSFFPAENVSISADPELLKMIFTNLGRNAIQAVGINGKVDFRIEWMLLDNRVNVEIIDDGCGISQDNMDKLFNPFFTTRTSGTGLGLALVKKAIDLHKGEIKVSSHLGTGANFSIRLPIKPFTPQI